MKEHAINERLAPLTTTSAFPRRALLRVPLALGAAATLAACRRRPAEDRGPGGPRSPVTARDLEQVTLRVADQMNLVRSQLQLSNQLDQTPYRITWAGFHAGPPLLEALGADAIDVGAVGDTPPIFAQAAGFPIRIIAAQRVNPAFSAILIPKGSALRSVGDLRGKRVAFAKASASHYLLLRALAGVGLRLSDIQPLYLTPNDAQPAFENGHLDAWAVWDPFVANNVLAGATRLIDGRGLVDGLGFVVSSASALADPLRAAALADHLRRLRAAQTWALAHRDLWRDSFAKLTGLALPVVTDMFTRFEPHYVTMDAGVRAAEQRVADEFFAGGLLQKRLNVNDVFDRRFEPSGGATVAL